MAVTQSFDVGKPDYRLLDKNGDKVIRSDWLLYTYPQSAQGRHVVRNYGSGELILEGGKFSLALLKGN